MDAERESEFIRSPVLNSQVLCLQSWCGDCGFTILAGSVYDLVEEEERHRQKCSPKRQPAQTVNEKSAPESKA